ncbi:MULTISPECIES: DeoR/GlpR family DNA-binding transcription regulator [Falsihalocynthiibacter]|uniref:DeoR/GlpR family DNA-binding transcription regulator n=1 Tax=Falsihalocynthiibacter TaxID=2854182 RepID=UPI003002F683
MLPSERHAIILREVKTQPAVSIRMLTEKLGVTRETVRKDIEQLAGENKLSKVRGGATQILTREPEVSTRVATNPLGKAKIAKHILGKIPDGASIIVDNGSTTFAVARLLREFRTDLIVHTNDLRIAELLGPVSREITVLGGRLDVAENATFGLDAMEQLARYRAEFALISTGGLVARALFTDFSRDAADLRHLMLQQAEQPFILADSSKFDVVGHVVMRPLPARTVVVVDTEPPVEITAAMSDQGIVFETA